MFNHFTFCRCVQFWEIRLCNVRKYYWHWGVYIYSSVSGNIESSYNVNHASWHHRVHWVWHKLTDIDVCYKSVYICLPVIEITNGEFRFTSEITNRLTRLPSMSALQSSHTADISVSSNEPINCWILSKTRKYHSCSANFNYLKSFFKIFLHGWGHSTFLQYKYKPP